MAKYTVRIEADKSLYPVLLSNGNLLGQGDLEVTSPAMQISLLHPPIFFLKNPLSNSFITASLACCRVVSIMLYGRIPSRNLATCLRWLLDSWRAETIHLLPVLVEMCH